MRSLMWIAKRRGSAEQTLRAPVEKRRFAIHCGTGKPVPYGAIKGLGRAGRKVNDKGKSDKENDPSGLRCRSAIQ